jgi:predicted permease
VLEFAPGAQGTSDVRDRYALAVTVLMGTAALLLVAACAGIANLFLARAFSRRAEVALRLSLGAGRGRLARQLLVEATTVAALGSIVGFILAVTGTGLLRALLGAEPLQHAVARPDGRALLFTAAASVLTALVMSAAPLAFMSTLDPVRMLKDRDRGAGGRGTLGQSVLVGAQIAVSLILIVGAGLFLRTLANLRALELGFDHDQVLVTRLEPEGSNQKRDPEGRFKVPLLRTYAAILEQVESLPGVRSASLAGATPLGGANENPLTTRVRRPGAAARDDDPQVRLVQVYPKYFSTMGIPVLAGRDLSAAENDPAAADAPVHSVVINRTMAATMFSGENAAVGQRFLSGSAGRAFEIVGVVEDVRDRGPREAVEPTAYATYAQTPTGRAQMTLFVRASGGLVPIASGVRDVIKAVDPAMPRLAVQPVAERVSDSIARERVVAVLATAFGVVALLLASISLYGVAAYAAARRTKEFGLRMALGARRGNLAALVLVHTGRLVVVGGAAGVVAAIAGSRLVTGHLFGVAPTDAATMAGALLLLALVTALATLVPIRRAMRLDPVAALRSE